MLQPDDQQLAAASSSAEPQGLPAELPYAASVETTAFEEKKDGSVRIEQTIYVEREGTKLLCIPLDSAPDAQLIAGAMRLQALYDVVWENSTEDERSIETAIDSALSFVEEFEGRTARKEA